jgi:prepilin-type N-terminal cleavage/methylation domain-containing protein
MKKANTQNGFTLTELMVVIVIVGILSAVALPQIFGVTAKAKATELVITFSAFKKVTQAHVELFGEVPTSIESAGMELTNGSFFDFSQNLEGELVALPSLKKKSVSGGNGQSKTTICHKAGASKSVTITVANPSIVQAHLDHGDGVGECDEPDKKLEVVAVAKGNIGGECGGGSTIKATVGLGTYSIEEVSGNCSLYLPSQFSKMIALMTS